MWQKSLQSDLEYGVIKVVEQPSKNGGMKSLFGQKLFGDFGFTVQSVVGRFGSP